MDHFDNIFTFNNCEDTVIDTLNNDTFTINDEEFLNKCFDIEITDFSNPDESNESTYQSIMSIDDSNTNTLSNSENFNEESYYSDTEPYISDDETQEKEQNIEESISKEIVFKEFIPKEVIPKKFMCKESVMRSGYPIRSRQMFEWGNTLEPEKPAKIKKYTWIPSKTEKFTTKILNKPNDKVDDVVSDKSDYKFVDETNKDIKIIHEKDDNIITKNIKIFFNEVCDYDHCKLRKIIEQESNKLMEGHKTILDNYFNVIAFLHHTPSRFVKIRFKDYFNFYLFEMITKEKDTLYNYIIQYRTITGVTIYNLTRHWILSQLSEYAIKNIMKIFIDKDIYFEICKYCDTMRDNNGK